jgi:hypothetical protein
VIVGAMPVPCVIAILAAAVPVTPDRETARRWAVEELADPAYARARPNPVTRALTWLYDRLNEILDRLPGNPSATGAVIAGILALLAVAVIVWLVAGPLRRTARVPRADHGVFGASVRTAEEHRAAAHAASLDGRWRVAVQEAFRGLARGLEERGVLDVRAGRTADEIAVLAAGSFPELGADLRRAARSFDDVTYGDRPGGAVAHREITDLDGRVGRLRPATAGALGRTTVSA